VHVRSVFHDGARALLVDVSAAAGNSLAHPGLQVKADRHIDEDHSIEELQEHSENLAHEDHHGVPHPRTGCAPHSGEGHRLQRKRSLPRIVDAAARRHTPIFKCSAIDTAVACVDDSS